MDQGGFLVRRSSSNCQREPFNLLLYSFSLRSSCKTAHFYGGAEGSRTPDLRRAKPRPHILARPSTSGIFHVFEDSSRSCKQRFVRGVPARTGSVAVRSHKPGLLREHVPGTSHLTLANP